LQFYIIGVNFTESKTTRLHYNKDSLLQFLKKADKCVETNYCIKLF